MDSAAPARRDSMGQKLEDNISRYESPYKFIDPTQIKSCIMLINSRLLRERTIAEAK
jgi:hypothetical protein